MEGYKILLRIQDRAKSYLINRMHLDYELNTTQIHDILKKQFQWKFGIDLVIDFMLINENDFRLLDLNENDAIWGLTEKHLEELE